MELVLVKNKKTAPLSSQIQDIITYIFYNTNNNSNNTSTSNLVSNVL